MNAVLANVRQLVDVELAAANERFPQFHSQHEGCAVVEAVREGKIAYARYESYLKILDEDEKYRK